jgi:hypothetical protein
MLETSIEKHEKWIIAPHILENEPEKVSNH